MEEKTIWYGPFKITRSKVGDISVQGMFVGSMSQSARGVAHAILELIGDPVPGKGETNSRKTYVTTGGAPTNWDNARIHQGWTDVFTNEDDAIHTISAAATCDDEFHIFRLVATVGPIPQPERKVTRYE